MAFLKLLNIQNVPITLLEAISSFSSLVYNLRIGWQLSSIQLSHMLYSSVPYDCYILCPPYHGSCFLVEVNLCFPYTLHSLRLYFFKCYPVLICSLTAQFYIFVCYSSEVTLATVKTFQTPETGNQNFVG